MTQQAYGFMVSQAKSIERKVYRKRYPSIQYPRLVPVDRSAHSWARGITHYSSDMIGRPEVLAGRANDFPLADIERAKHDVPIEMAGLGYDYTLEELNHAMMTGVPLTADKAMAVRRGVEEYIDNIVNVGKAELGWDSLLKPKGVRRVAASGTTSAARLWSAKEAPAMATDVNTLLQGLYTDTKTVEMADTLLVPTTIWSSVFTKVLSGTTMTVFDFIKRSNVYTATTGRPLRIIEYRGLETAGWNDGTIAVGTTGDTADEKPTNGSTESARLIAFRRDPEVLKLHMPMPIRFLPVWQSGPMRWIVPAIFRLGGLEIRLPKAMRVMDGI